MDVHGDHHDDNRVPSGRMFLDTTQQGGLPMPLSSPDGVFATGHVHVAADGTAATWFTEAEGSGGTTNGDGGDVDGGGA